MPMSSKLPPMEALDSGPSVVTAMREQLGLKLSAGTGAVEVLVIERVEQPMERLTPSKAEGEPRCSPLRSHQEHPSD